jgi:hypothetical protein
MGQKEMMCQLIAKYGYNEELICRAYAAAERRGGVPRNSHYYGMTPEEYARTLWRDGIRKGWFQESEHSV